MIPITGTTTICGARSRNIVTRDLSPARVLIAGVAWRTFGTRRSGDLLIEAMSGDDEQNRMLAGMALVKAGERSVELIEKKVEAGEASTPVIKLLPDLGTPRARALLEQIASENSGDQSEVARAGLHQLERMDAVKTGKP